MNPPQVPAPAVLPSGPPSSVSQDAEHLKLLSIFHYITGALTMVFSSLGLIYVFLGILALSGKLDGTSPHEAQFVGCLFLAIGGGVTLLGWTSGICQLLAGRWLSARRHRTFCFVVACVECINMPLGTALGVFTIIVLQRPSVRALFEESPAR